jgi:hypothetical protein
MWPTQHSKHTRTKHREPQLFAVIQSMLSYAGSSRRVGDLYASRSIMNKAKTMIKGLKVRASCVS